MRYGLEFHHSGWSFKIFRTIGFIWLAAGLFACQSGDDLPEPSTEAYDQTVTDFYVGVASVQSGQDRFANENFTAVTERAPGEPAGWANLGLLALRQRDFEAAEDYLARARELAPQNDQIVMLQGYMAENRGQFDAAVEQFRRAIELNPDNLKARYALARILEQREGGQPPEEVQRLLEEVHQMQPRNLPVLIEWARVSAERNDGETLRRIVRRIDDRSSSWPEGQRQQLEELQQVVDAGDIERAVRQLAFLKNVLKQLPAYRQGLAAVETPAAQVGELITEFLRLPGPEAAPATPDTSLSFERQLVDVPVEDWSIARVIPIQNGTEPTVVVGNGERIRVDENTSLPFPGGPSNTSPTRDGIAAIDVDYDFVMDVVVAGAGGVRLFRQDSLGAFEDISTQLPASVRDGAYRAVWTADIDMEGDMDIVLARREAAPLVLRNNGDGSFTVQRPFEEVRSVRDFAWADFDGDGDPDGAFVDDSGQLTVYLNHRSGTFSPLEAVPDIGRVAALEVADLNGDGVIDLMSLGADGTVRRLSRDLAAHEWRIPDVISTAESSAQLSPGRAGLFVRDYDNNGQLDILLATPNGARIWLGMGQDNFHDLSHRVTADVQSVADMTDDGRLDLIAREPDGRPMRLVNRGDRQYGWYIARPRASQTTGDQRINSFGIGGEIEMRAGLQYQKQVISGPQVHFGLGTHETAELMRIIWPNGSVQAEFDMTANNVLRAEQRLKGSCPWLFTYDGTEMRFVKDFIWRSGLGIRINAQETAGIMQTLDRVKIPGEYMEPRNGYYDVRITAELWETHFFDHVSLEIVDHPESTEVFVDERFTAPVDLSPRAVGPVREVSSVETGDGRTVTETVRDRDGDYLGGFEMTAYQGLARDHYIEIDLGDDVPNSGPLWLVAYGWLYPTDSSINIALSQGSHPSPGDLRMEVPDGNGGWKLVKDNLGFPAGKLKTILLDLEDVFEPGTDRRLRLHTTAEIYWDQIGWAEGRPETQLQIQEVPADSAVLRYRGFSRVTEDGQYAPEVPQYDAIVGTAPRWRDLVGYYTRFGDVRELLADIEDRYVIMNAGDEMVLRFKAPPPPPEGWSRDFVLVGDGWVKDGDYNTKLSKTVRPLPYHEQSGYTGPLGSLTEDVVYRRYSDDWRVYHTRYVGTDQFQQAISDVR
jgi:thioredoxin-like negative regulator of GroEL